MTIEVMIMGSGLPRLEAEMLLAHVLGMTRTQVLARGNENRGEEVIRAFGVLVERRKKSEPVAYIIEKKEFYGREFMVNPSVLIPRPSTEVLVEVALNILRKREASRSLSGDGTNASVGSRSDAKKEIAKVVDDREHSVTSADTDIAVVARTLTPGPIEDIYDLGTGSGCIAITLALEKPEYRIVAVDTSEAALAVAKENADLHAVSDRIDFRLGDAAKAVRNAKKPFLIVSNPPYIPAGTPLEKDVREYEPHGALFSGERGTDVLESIVEAAASNSLCRGYALECRTDQIGDMGISRAILSA